MDPRNKLTRIFGSPWNPKPVDPPIVDHDIENLDPLTRSAESIRHGVLSVEFWLSPNGEVREWLRQNTRLAVVLAIPAFLVLPVITFALWQLVSWLAALVLISGKLIVLPILALIAAVVFTIVCLIFRVLFK